MNILEQKLNNNERLNYDEALSLWDLDLTTLGFWANKIRREKFDNKVYYNINRHINPTNVCKDVCKFCAFSASRKNPNAYTMSHDEILDIVKQASDNGALEVHIVSAHNNKVPIEWYFDIFSAIKSKYPHLHIKALTAAEINFLSEFHNKSYDEICSLMIESGVDSMPGGGAEIFDEVIRKKICHGKVSSDNWLKIHETWHNLGKKSNATMLFGHIENRAHRVDHMMRLRDLQDKTNGFNAFIPLLYQRDNNFLKVGDKLSAVEILKTYAISRIVLDNIPNLKAYWVTLSMNLALVAMEYGANDLDGTIQKESINSAAGAKSANGMSQKDFVTLIKNAKFEPILRDSLYNEI